MKIFRFILALVLTVLILALGAGVFLGYRVSKLDTKGQNALVSLLENKGVRYLMLVSRSIDDPMQVDVAFRRKACLVDRNGIFVPVGRHPETMTVEPGDALIFRISK